MLITVGVTIEIYLFFLLMGWGATRLLLPDSTRPYQFWFAPWFGLIITTILTVWLSQLGLVTNQSAYIVLLLGIGLLVLCKLRKISLTIPLQKIDGIIALGALISLFLALYPLLAVNPSLTTISLENQDPVFYSVAGDFLKSHSIKNYPQFSSEQPWTWLIYEAIAPGHRPGCWLLFGLIASQFNLETYQIFTLTLDVFFALTPPLITIFTWVLTKRSFPTMIALTLSVLNVNLLYFNYHGFAAQVLAQGCLILAFLWFYLAAHGEEPFNHYLLPIGLCSASLFMLYPELGIFFVMPLAIYVIFKFIYQLIYKKSKNFNYLINLALVYALTFLIDPIGFIKTIRYLLFWSNKTAGWSMPRWPLPVDMVGLFSIHSSTNYPIFLLFFASLLVTVVMVLGLLRLNNKAFFFSLIAFSLAVFLWFGLVRKFSYGYYKSIGFLTFAIIIIFSIGLASIVVLRHSRLGQLLLQWGTLCLVGFCTTFAVWPTFQYMVTENFRVTPELETLSEIPTIIKERKLYLDTGYNLEQMWAVNFLKDTNIEFLMVNPYRPKLKLPNTIKKEGFLLKLNNTEGFIINSNKIPWRNHKYILINNEVDESKIQVKLDKNWWPAEIWKKNTFDSKIIHWMNQDGTIKIENKYSIPRKIELRFKFFPIHLKSTVDIYLNNDLIQTLKLASIPGEPKFSSFYGNLKPGDNQLRFHVREGAVQPLGDIRQLALGVNAIRFAIDR